MPVEAGLAYAVSLYKPGFIGREALSKVNAADIACHASKPLIKSLLI